LSELAVQFLQFAETQRVLGKLLHDLAADVLFVQDAEEQFEEGELFYFVDALRH
jgi:hypothetical protein